MQVTIVGAGVLGLAAALALTERGVRVQVVDPHPAAGNASAVAAGLLAPVGEAVFDPAAAAHYPLLREALALWPAFADSAGLALSDDGLVLNGATGPALTALGVAATVRGGALFVREDPRVIDPPAALRALCAAVEARGGQVEARAFAPGRAAAADRVVLAAGPGPVEGLAAPELSALTPVKGQIAVLPHGPAAGPTVRWPGGYLAPQPGGARVGATMEVGRRDTRVEPAALAALLAAAQQHAPDLDVRAAAGQAGVRMQTADGLPLVGPSALPGVLLATGARRNGWLFAPLVGRMIAAYCTGENPGPWAAQLHPGRFAHG